MSNESAKESLRLLNDAIEEQENGVVVHSANFEASVRKSFKLLYASEMAAITFFALGTLLTYREFRRRTVAETLLEESHRGLEARVRERTEQLDAANAELQRSTQLLKSVLDSMSAGVIACNERGQVILWNRAAEEFHGPELRLPGPDKWSEMYGLFDASGRTKLKPQEVPLELARRGVVTRNVELTVRPPGRPERSMLVSATPVHLFDGLSGAVVVFQDITEKKELEHQFLRTQRLESVGAISAGIVHDVNNVLAPILMGVELLKMNPDPNGAMQTLDTIGNSARRGADLIKQILAFTRGIKSERSLVRVDGIIREIAKVARDSFPKGITLKVEIEPGLWPVMVDATQLHQVLMNLCVNARDSLGKSGTITLAAHNIGDGHGQNHAPADRSVQITVTDNGPGIPSELHEKIFEPFFTTKEPGKGTGLGLSTVAAIVRNHAGNLRLVSAPHKGASFVITFPAVLQAIDGAAALPSSLPRGNGETILFVEDEDTIRSLAEETLRAHGYNVLAAHHGSAGLNMYFANRQAVSLVVTDLEMPVLDGRSIIRAIKDDNPTVRILAMSGSGDTNLEALGADDFLQKPFATHELLIALKNLLGGG